VPRTAQPEAADIAAFLCSLATVSSVHSPFDELVDTVTPTVASLCTALRAMISELHPTRFETVWLRQGVASYGIGPKKHSEHYAYLAPEDGWVRLGFYRGAFFNDRAERLLGRGPRVRHLRIATAEHAADPALKSLLREAISERLAARA
jgi:hypothetical protein